MPESGLAQARPTSALTKIIEANRDDTGSGRVSDDDRIISQLLPEAKGKNSLIGGVVRTLDNVLDRMVVRPFGGNDVVILFDNRTRVYRDGIPASLSDLRPGDRIYADTALAGRDIFAKSLHLSTENQSGRSQGQVLRYDAIHRELAIRDAASHEPINFSLAANTTITRNREPASPAELRVGSMVTLKFLPSTTIRPPLAEEISILATPGQTFEFAGRISYLDLSTGLLVLTDAVDNKNYEVHFDPAIRPVNTKLHEGADVVVSATFDGTRYTAGNIVFK